MMCCACVEGWGRVRIETCHGMCGGCNCIEWGPIPIPCPNEAVEDRIEGYGPLCREHLDKAGLGFSLPEEDT